MKFLKDDYLGENKNQSLKQTTKAKGNELAKKLNELTDKEERMKRELEKIRKLDGVLA